MALYAYIRIKKEEGHLKDNRLRSSTDIIQDKASVIMPLSDSILSGALTESRSAGYTFPRHMHSTVEIYRILSGECYMDIRSETVHCRQNDFIMILPDVVHSLYLNKESGCSFQHVHFNPELFSKIVLEDNGIQPVTLLHAILFSSYSYYYFSSDNTIDGMLDRLISLYSSSDSLFSAANINIALIHLMLHILDKSRSDRIFSFPQRQNSYMAYTLNYIRERYAEKIMQEDIARQLHVSDRYLRGLFKTYMGLSLSSYINIYRINRSIELMADSSLSLTDIALRVGFNDSQRYSKVFMQIINTTPSQYRKLITKSVFSDSLGARRGHTKSGDTA